MSNIVLRKQGDSAVIPQIGSELSEYIPGIKRIKAVLEWRSAVDLDIHAFYRLKKRMISGHVYFAAKGNPEKSPYIHLDEDMGIGNVAGRNREIITIGTLADVESVLIATNIYSSPKGNVFARYGGRVRLITSKSDTIEVPLTSPKPASWCVIALIDNSDPYSPLVTNINKVTDDVPRLDDYLDDDIHELTYDG